MKIGKHTAKLLREAIVLAYVEGACWGRANDREVKHPRDSEVVNRVLSASVSFSDLYPTLSKLDVAREADAARRAETAAFLKAMMKGIDEPE